MTFNRATEQRGSLFTNFNLSAAKQAVRSFELHICTAAISPVERFVRRVIFLRSTRVTYMDGSNKSR